MHTDDGKTLYFIHVAYFVYPDCNTVSLLFQIYSNVVDALHTISAKTKTVILGLELNAQVLKTIVAGLEVK